MTDDTPLLAIGAAASVEEIPVLNVPELAHLLQPARAPVQPPAAGQSSYVGALTALARQQYDQFHSFSENDGVLRRLGVITTGYALTVGGNEGNSVGLKRVALCEDGFIRQRERDPYICVIQNLK